MFVECRQRGAQLSAAQQIHIAAPPFVHVWSEHPTAQRAPHDLKGVQVSAMQADLQRRLLTVAGKVALADDEPDAEAESIKLHGPTIPLFPIGNKVSRGTLYCEEWPLSQRLPNGGARYRGGAV